MSDTQPSRALAKVDEVRGQLDKMRSQFALALPEHVSPEKFVRVVMTAVQSDPKLLQADRQTLFGAAMKCAQDGLLPDGRDAALVCYGTSVSYLPMIAGILSKVRRSGELKSITAHVVYENDAFSYTLGDDEKIEHQPCMTGDRGRAIAAYGVAKTKDGGIYREVMTLEEINQVRNVSRAKNGGPWTQWWGEMARKTVLRRLSKRLPMSTDLQQVFERDNEHYDLTPPAPKVRTLHADFDEPVIEPSHDPVTGEIDEVLDGDHIPDAEFTDAPLVDGSFEASKVKIEVGDTVVMDGVEKTVTTVVTAGPPAKGDGFDVLDWAANLLRSLEFYTSVDELRTDWSAHKDALKAAHPDMFKQLNQAVAGRAKEIGEGK